MATAVPLLVAAGTLATSLRGGNDEPATQASAGLATPVAGVGAQRTASAGGGAPTALASPVRSAPVSLRIPALDLAALVDGVGLNPDQTVEVPADPDRTGWYRLGPVPGQAGSAVILGHLDSATGPAVFYRLRFLRAGDEIGVTLADGIIARFAVQRVATYPNGKFPAGRVYGSRGAPWLQLVTCGGPYDRRARTYLAIVVVYSSLVSLSRAPLPETEPRR